jgi:hypothetical protein
MSYRSKSTDSFNTRKRFFIALLIANSGDVDQ